MSRAIAYHRPAHPARLTHCRECARPMVDFEPEGSGKGLCSGLCSSSHGLRGSAKGWKRGLMYAAADTESWAVKIGFTVSSPSARVSSMQSGNPRNIELLCAWPGKRGDEAAAHRAASRLATHIRGEWFRINEGLLTWLVQTASDRGGKVIKPAIESLAPSIPGSPTGKPDTPTGT